MGNWSEENRTSQSQIFEVELRVSLILWKNEDVPVLKDQDLLSVKNSVSGPFVNDRNVLSDKCFYSLCILLFVISKPNLLKLFFLGTTIKVYSNKVLNLSENKFVVLSK
ncbi:Inactive Tyrosine-Protein Kinase Transmembrane Receptor Ror1 [Manis pentadactyla]|nr:Inactive Tyrosine-Protein Kinase Transmembrane Receptor Ror1 [Manis pentadactyla]